MTVRSPRPIVYIEDDPEDIARFEKLLRAEHITNPLLVFPTAEAFQRDMPKLELKELGLMLIDNCLVGGMDGIEFLTWFKKESGADRIPMVMVTGSDEHASIHLAGQAGADGYLVKPVHPKTMIDVINKAAEQHREFERYGFEIVTEGQTCD